MESKTHTCSGLTKCTRSVMSGSFAAACFVLQAPAGYSCIYIRAPTVPASSTVSISVLAASSDHPPGLWTAGSFCKEIAPTVYNWSWVGVSWWFNIISIHWSWWSNSEVQLSSIILQANTMFMYFMTKPICMTYQNSSKRYTVDDFMTFDFKKIKLSRLHTMIFSVSIISS